MKVYIVYTKDGYNGSMIDRVFANRQSARNHIISYHFLNNSYYAGLSKEKLDDAADSYVEEYDVEE
jgi:hypothetical protein